MRIIAGSLGGRVFASPRGHRTHPMADKVRGGLFNALGDISGLAVMDAFSGSGALGFEALSRGAAHVIAVESDKNAQRTISENVASLGVSSSHKLIRATVHSWLSTAQAVVPFDIILVDPPYQDLQLSSIQELVALLKRGGVLVVSWPGMQEAPQLSGLEIVRQKSYGDAQLIFYRAA